MKCIMKPVKNIFLITNLKGNKSTIRVCIIINTSEAYYKYDILLLFNLICLLFFYSLWLYN